MTRMARAETNAFSRIFRWMSWFESMMFLKLSSRIRLASTSKTLQKLIFQDCIPLWREIDFSDLPYATKQSLTDEMLASLLIRVNAKSVTRTINLTSCNGIQGTGLEPLRGSEVLEILDMMEAYHEELTWIQFCLFCEP